MRAIHTDKAPKVVGPYAQAIVANGFVFCSGQIGINPASGQLVEGLANQTKQILTNMRYVLEEAGSSIEHVVKTTIFITDMAQYVTVNTLYGEVFEKQRPARSTVEVSKLPTGALIEIEAIAVLRE